MKPWQHLKTICHHRRLVRQGCFRVGLYWQGLTHDLSKFSPTEFWSGAKYFQGNRSPNSAQREAEGYSVAWMHPATVIIMNTGPISSPARESTARCLCRENTWPRWSWTAGRPA